MKTFKIIRIKWTTELQCQQTSTSLWCMIGIYTCTLASTIYAQDYKNDHKIWWDMEIMIYIQICVII